MLNEQIRLLKSEKDLLEMPENGRDICKTGIIEKFTDRPIFGKFLAFQNLFLTELHLHIIKKTVNAENDFQSTNLPEPVDNDDNCLRQLLKSIKF